MVFCHMFKNIRTLQAATESVNKVGVMEEFSITSVITPEASLRSVSYLAGTMTHSEICLSGMAKSSLEEKGMQIL